MKRRSPKERLIYKVFETFVVSMKRIPIVLNLKKILISLSDFIRKKEKMINLLKFANSNHAIVPSY